MKVGEGHPDLLVSAYDYPLPPESIAQHPAEPRDSSRLLVLEASSDRLLHKTFRDLPDLLRPGDLLVANRSRVIPARLLGHRRATGGRVEVLLLRKTRPRQWEALLRPGRAARPDSVVELAGGRLRVRVRELISAGRWLVELDADDGDPDTMALQMGTIPVPPYIRGWHGDPERYQTVYADRPGSVAAPTAGLHFTPGLLSSLEARGIRMAFVTLHVGLDTFRPMKVDRVDQHSLHSEWAELSPDAAAAITRARAEGRRIIAVGTTTVRVLETAASRHRSGQPGSGPVVPFEGWTDLYIRPGFTFQVVEAMITNFHLPRSTLLLLVSAFVGRERILAAYQEALQRGYRFGSFGDAMLLL